MSSYGPWAVVTGASSGIGRAFAEHLAASAVNVVLVARSTERLTSLGADLRRDHGVAYRVVTADLSSPDGARTVLAACADLDVGLLVSNAGGGHPGLFLDQELKDLHRRLTLNTTTHMELSYGFGRRFVARGGGGVLLVSALGAVHGLPNMAHESAARAYVLNLGEALHYELAPAKVNVMVMLPGNVDTPIIETFGLDRADLPIRPRPAAAAVRETLAAFGRHRPMHIPGRLMRMMTRFVPRSRLVRLNGRMLGRAAANLRRRESALA
ncbi:SDR family NAD(P)-dependent oxidoreductase [Luedemannella flava]|uniref:SDR family NAD(P)-dependent oxidoreductase n=1 Tax=Luedemannella flava TaxID=349316 RepID=UPI0031D62190